MPARPHDSESGGPDGAEIALSELWVRDGARHRSAVRWELFLFRAVRDVLARRDPDRVLIVHGGPPDPEAWVEVLRDAGFEAAPAPGHSSCAGPPDHDGTPRDSSPV
jgi:hypothetical protein